MTVEIYIPKKMSDHLETDRIIRWLVKEGDMVKRGQVLFEVERDNAVCGVEAPAEGYAQVYPEAWRRIQARRTYMQESLGLHLAPEVLPFSYLAAHCSPSSLRLDAH